MTRKRRKPGDGAAQAAPSILTPEQARTKAMEAALRLLSFRERSETELRRRLGDKGYEPLVVDHVLVRLRETGLQDDRRFAERFAAEGAAKGKAARLIQRELAGRGVDRGLAAEASVALPEEDTERAMALATRRASTMSSLPPHVRVQRIAGLLARRGFDPDTCWRVAREAAGEIASDTDPT